jgi:hypothetical protein
LFNWKLSQYIAQTLGRELPKVPIFMRDQFLVYMIKPLKILSDVIVQILDAERKESEHFVNQHQVLYIYHCSHSWHDLVHKVGVHICPEIFDESNQNVDD